MAANEGGDGGAAAVPPAHWGPGPAPPPPVLLAEVDRALPVVHAEVVEALQTALLNYDNWDQKSKIPLRVRHFLTQEGIPGSIREAAIKLKDLHDKRIALARALITAQIATSKAYVDIGIGKRHIAPTKELIDEQRALLRFDINEELYGSLRVILLGIRSSFGELVAPTNPDQIAAEKKANETGSGSSSENASLQPLKWYEAMYKDQGSISLLNRDSGILFQALITNALRSAAEQNVGRVAGQFRTMAGVNKGFPMLSDVDHTTAETVYDTVGPYIDALITEGAGDADLLKVYEALGPSIKSPMRDIDKYGVSATKRVSRTFGGPGASATGKANLNLPPLRTRKNARNAARTLGSTGPSLLSELGGAFSKAYGATQSSVGASLGIPEEAGSAVPPSASTGPMRRVPGSAARLETAARRRPGGGYRRTRRWSKRVSRKSKMTRKSPKVNKKRSTRKHRKA